MKDLTSGVVPNAATSLSVDKNVLLLKEKSNNLTAGL